VSLIVALISYLGKRKSDRELAQLNAELIETQERRKAQRDYGHEARKRLYSEWNAVRSLTELGSHPIAYEPNRGKSKVLAPTNPAIEARQHLNLQQIDQAVESLIIEDGPARLLRCRTYGEFVEAYRDEKSTVSQTCVRMMRLFEDSISFTNPVEAFDIQERNDFDWRPRGSEATVEEAIEGTWVSG
jgi:hypothetical protein